MSSARAQIAQKYLGMKRAAVAVALIILALSASAVCADLVARERPQVDSPNAGGTTYQMMSGVPGSNWAACRND